jgi:hypothetical protein
MDGRAGYDLGENGRVGQRREDEDELDERMMYLVFRVIQLDYAIIRKIVFSLKAPIKSSSLRNEIRVSKTIHNVHTFFQLGLRRRTYRIISQPDQSLPILYNIVVYIVFYRSSQAVPKSVACIFKFLWERRLSVEEKKAEEK